MIYSPSAYMFCVSVKLKELAIPTLVDHVFPNARDLIFSSKKYEASEQACTTAVNVITEICGNLNKAAKKELYKPMAEYNPADTGEATLSKTWADNEIAKIWIVDRSKKDKGPIKVVGMAQVIESHSDDMVRLN